MAQSGDPEERTVEVHEETTREERVVEQDLTGTEGDSEDEDAE